VFLEERRVKVVKDMLENISESCEAANQEIIKKNMTRQVVRTVRVFSMARRLDCRWRLW